MSRETKAGTTKGNGHRQRLRQKFLESGLAGFQDYEVIEFLLTLGTPRKDCKPSAKELLRRFKSLPAVLEARPSELARVAGVGPVNVLGIKLIKAVADRYMERRINGMDVISNSKDLLVFLNQTIGYRDREVFSGIFLDARNRVIAAEVLFEGTLTASAVYPRDVVARALDLRSACVIVAHNHPSGDPGPSDRDRAVTRRLVFALRYVDIRLHEHLVIGREGVYSFADHGIMDELHREFDRLNG